MPGGSQEGGPLVKRTLSRVAGLSLHWLAGVATHDATNNFKAYSKRFLGSVKVEAQGAFDIGLELSGSFPAGGEADQGLQHADHEQHDPDQQHDIGKGISKLASVRLGVDLLGHDLSLIHI